MAGLTSILGFMDSGVMEEGDGPPASIEQHQMAGVSILLQIVMLLVAFVLGHVLRRHKFYYLHEASASLLIGIVVGTIANIFNTEESFRRWFNFNEEFFFLFLLPPIIFQSGFSLYPKPFFSNFGAICTFAILGTFIASMVTGILVYLGGLFFFMYRLSFLESLLFGSLISATDPVTVLSIFQELGTDVNLYALVFGESVLNDAVAISLFKSLMKLWRHPHAEHSFLSGTWSFFETFAGSMSTGAGVALGSALLFKYAGLQVNSLQNLECCLMVLFPYFSFMLAEGLGLSGIVAILFCGIFMRRYTASNLSENTRNVSAGFFQLASSLAETFVFLYMGLDIATEKHSWSHVGFIFFSIVFILVARAANVFPCAYLVNVARSTADKVPLNHQKALWFSGLRGAMAFALALQAMHDLPEKEGRLIFTTTTAIVVLTVLFIGGSTATMLEKLDVVGAGPNELENEEEKQKLADSEDLESGQSSPNHYLKVKLRELQDSAAPTFNAIDQNFLKPFFTTPMNEEEASESSSHEPAHGGNSRHENIVNESRRSTSAVVSGGNSRHENIVNESRRSTSAQIEKTSSLKRTSVSNLETTRGEESKTRSRLPSPPSHSSLSRRSSA